MKKNAATKKELINAITKMAAKDKATWLRKCREVAHEYGQYSMKYICPPADHRDAKISAVLKGDKIIGVSLDTPKLIQRDGCTFLGTESEVILF